MNEERLVFEIAKQENRPNPYPLYAQARQVGICRQHDGAYVVSRYREVSALLHDPRVSSDPRNLADPGPLPPAFPFIMQDAPNHDRLRRIAMNQFGPPDHAGLVASKESDIAARMNALLADLDGRTEIDVVDDLAYPLPVAVICDLLGVPPEDEPKFKEIADALVRTVGSADQEGADEARGRSSVSTCSSSSPVTARSRATTCCHGSPTRRRRTAWRTWTWSRRAS